MANYNKIIIDEEDSYLLEKHCFCINNGYAVCRIDGKNKYLHRIIMEAKDGEIIDHKNGNRLDNRKENLRHVTKQQNNMNRAIGKNNKTGIKGVKYLKDRKKYRAYIFFNKKEINLGCFNTLEEAKKVRIEAENKYFGEYVRC